MDNRKIIDKYQQLACDSDGPYRDCRGDFLTGMSRLDKNLAADAAVLAMGAGAGIYAAALAETGRKVLAIVSRDSEFAEFEGFRAELKKTVSDLSLTLRQGNLETYRELGTETFDAVILADLTDNLKNDWQRLDVIMEATRVLKTNGILLATSRDPATFTLLKAANLSLEMVPLGDFTDALEDNRDSLDEATFAARVDSELAGQDAADGTACFSRVAPDEDSETVLYIGRNDDPAFIAYPEDHEVADELELYTGLDYRFYGHADVHELWENDLTLKLERTADGDPEAGDLPAYYFSVKRLDKTIGECVFRVGYNEKTYYEGNVGVTIDKPYRGRGYGLRALLLLRNVAKRHRMSVLSLTQDVRNLPARRISVKSLAEYRRTIRLPEDNAMREDGLSWMNIFFLRV